MRLIEIIKDKINYIIKIGELFDKKEKVRFVVIMVLAIITALFQALGIASVLPFMNMVMEPSIIESNEHLSYFYNLFNFQNTSSFIIYTGILVLAIIIIGNAVSAITHWLKIAFVWRNNHKLSVALLKKYLSLPYSYFLNQNTSDLGKNILAEVQNLTQNFILPFLKIVTGLVLTFVIFVMLLYVNPQMTLIAAVVLISLYLLIYFRFSVRIKRGGERRIIENKRRFQLAGEALGGIKDVKVLGKESYFVEDFGKHSEKFNNLQAWHQIVGKIPKYIMEIFAFGGVVVLVLFLVSSGQSTAEIIPLIGFFAFAGYRLMPALQDIFDSFTIFRFNKAVLNKIHKDMKEKGIERKEVLSKKSILEPISFKKEIELKDISFFYPQTRKKVLEDINLKIKKNTSVAIIGSTGSGKTTLADIILALFFPQEGKIIVDGVEIKEENARNWQVNIGYVPQQIYLSDNTIMHNIAFGVPNDEIDMKQVKNVAKMANIDEFIEKELSNGYETLIGERGIRLSGGQRQRVGIARALYHDPEILMFDEATSSLDNVTEKMVLDAIDTISKLKTMVIIAHRLTTIKNCDNIYLIDRGKIVASGTYDELLINNKHFQKMIKSK